MTEPKLALYDFLRDRLGLPLSTDFVGIGRIVDRKLIAVVGYNNFTGTSCQMHMAGDHASWITRKFIREAFRYPFVTLNLKMVLAIIPSGCGNAVDIDKRLGFRELLYIPDAHPDGGMHVLEMRREECRWIGD